MRSSEAWSRLGGVLIAVLAAAAAMVVLVPRLLGVAAGPEVEIITHLKGTERDGLSLVLPGVGEPLTSLAHHFARITVNVEPGGQRAVAWATLDFRGRLGRTEVSSLGVERIAFVRRGREWMPEGLAAPRLAAVVRALESRRRALEAGDREALAGLLVPGAEADGGGGEEELARVMSLQRRRYRAEAWFLRLERDEAVATEQWRLEGQVPSRPVDERGQRRLSLVRNGEEFFFSPGLM
ncbi:hypothetical protein [Vitiosangium sp. GDMCC 1.1324]|uniref:hypothetical protein n=1 Tax=Vitiosangium sp. (strain GDMCC 1.1324) TaxID=2138576 RepID=UPI000D37C692|nr:hypothetical protein [Vitiosangium sp. GDMCC 1.1324]PTL77640.1 hypothetical protein DAT35_43410 [Vitiosangium sp. GDMCC 1.1324]